LAVTIWQSLGMINAAQLAYAAGLVVMFAMHGRSFIAFVLLADFIAVTLAMGAMDMGWLVRTPERDTVTATVLVIYCLTFAALVLSPGLGQVLAVFSAISIPIFAATLFFGVPVAATSAIVNACSLVQIAVAIIGMGDDNGNGHRRPRVADPVPFQGADQGLGHAASQAGYQPISPNRRG
jgi:hypothetical protein